MRALLIVLGLSVLAALAWLLTRDRPPPPPQPPAATEHQRPRPEPSSSMATERAEIPDTEPTPAEPKSTEPPPQPQPEADHAASPIDVEVQDAVSGARLPRFRYVLVHADGEREAEQVEGSTTALSLAAGERAELTVEAEEHVPQRVLVPSDRGQPVVVRLERTAPRTGVQLTVQDADGAAVPWLEVAAYASDADPPRLLWRRRAHDEDGVYALPDLPAGTVRLELTAITADGAPRPLLTAAETVQLTGDEAVIRSVQLVAGALFALHVPGDNERVQPLAVRLLDAAGRPQEMTWIGESEGTAVARRGGFPAAGDVRPRHAVPPGLYRLEVSDPATGAQTSTPLGLQPGDNAAVDVALPLR